MNIQFLGATQTVTGSKYLIHANDTSILVDCGLFQGFKHLRLRNWAPLMLPKLDALILTHAHLDHSGAIPILIKNGFRGPIHCTSATYDLCKILLPDAGFLQEEEARFANKHGFSKHKPALPLFTQKEAEECIKYFEPTDFESEVQTKSFRFKLIPAGHLLGAASVWLTNGKSRLVLSGDLGRSIDLINRAPSVPPGAESVVIESTYGNRLHPNHDVLTQIADIINRTFKRGGTLLIPSFAVGRAQLILTLVHQLKSTGRIPEIPVYLNSPMAAQANDVFVRYSGEHRLSKELAKEICAGARVVKSVEESIALNADTEPKIIIAASGMAVGGRVLHHLKVFAPDPKNTIAFTGFQAAGTRGEAMVNGAKEVKIHGTHWPIRAEVVNLDTLSAHADQSELIDWLQHLPTRPKKVFVTHGEPSASDALRFEIVEKLGIDAVVPEPGQSFDI